MATVYTLELADGEVRFTDIRTDLTSDAITANLSLVGEFEEWGNVLSLDEVRRLGGWCAQVVAQADRS